MRIRWFAAVICVALAVALSPQAPNAAHHEGGPKVMQVFLIDADAKDRPAALQRFKDLQGILKGEGQPGFRVWMATYAGTNTGRLVLTVERNGYADFGANTAQVMGSAAVQKWVTDMNKSGIAKVVSQSLLHEVTP